MSSERCLPPWIRFFRSGISLTLATMLGLDIVKLSMCLERVLLSICQRCTKVIFFTLTSGTLCNEICSKNRLYKDWTW